MKANSRVFSTDVELHCKVFWGPKARLEFSGTAVSIDSGSMSLRFPGDHSPYPNVGDRVHLEVSLPVSSKKAAAKCLALRAEVVQVSDAGDGSRQLNLHFRKAAFRDLGEGVRPKSVKTMKKVAFQ